jgi:hypothetical protein
MKNNFQGSLPRAVCAASLVVRVPMVLRRHLLTLALPIFLSSIVATWRPIVPWAFAQIIKSVWPFHSEVAARIEQKAWAMWESEVSGRRLDPDSVLELHIGEDPPSDRSVPYVVRGLLNGSNSKLIGSFDWLMQDPVGALEVDYFTNVSADDAIVPDARATLAKIVGNIVAGGSNKIGTEMIFRTFPELLEELKVAERVAPLLGSDAHIQKSRLGTTLTVPVFMATGAPRARTDLHCEPIGNMMLMLGGRKRWILAGPDQSRFLRPTLSKDGRAYFVSSQPTENPDESLAHVKRWVVETGPGDALWVPTWTWHRVDYINGVTALSASLFHIRLEQWLSQNALYSGLVIPNILKELVGWKTQ